MYLDEILDTIMVVVDQHAKWCGVSRAQLLKKEIRKIVTEEMYEDDYVHPCNNGESSSE